MVKDEPLVLSTTVRVLSDQGYRVLQASNGEEGLRTVKEYTSGEINLLLADEVMPKMDGPELARQLRELRPDVKILFTSGYKNFDHLHDGASPLENGVGFI